jgi:uncharacterized protein (DUF885 family)
MLWTRGLGLIVFGGLVVGSAAAQTGAPKGAPNSGGGDGAKAVAPAPPAWVARSNQYTRQLLDVQFKYSPEGGSGEGIAKYDTLITDPTLAAEKAQRKELEETLARVEREGAKDKSPEVREDLEIIDKSFRLEFKREDYRLAHKVPFIDASSAVFGGLRTLLDDQVPAERRPAAVVRLKKYAGLAPGGLEPGTKPFTDLLKQRIQEQMTKPGVIYPAAGQMETELGRDKNYIDGMEMLFRRYKLTGWEQPMATLREQLADYDTWVRANVMPKARKDFRLTPEEYGLALENYGVDIPPAQLAQMAHQQFSEIQAQMATVAAQVAKQHGWSSTDYRDVIHELKKNQITGDEVLPFYKKRLGEIEAIIREKNLVTLPDRPAIIRLATAAETAQQPAPHMDPPPFLNNTGQKGEFVLPLNVPSANGGEADKYDDFNFDAVTWTMIAHEARPGHELQFDSMVEHGVSLARALYAFNSTNVEGWGLYSEWMMQPYEPQDGQLMTLQLRLLRAARAFLDPELEAGKVTPEDAYKVLEHDVCLSHAFAQEEVERFTYRMPGQANSYFYGYTKLLKLRKDAEAALGAKFDQKKFHDFVLAQGLLPPDLMRKAVMETFVPSQKAVR